MQQHILRIIRINLNVENGFIFRVKTRVLFPKFDSCVSAFIAEKNHDSFLPLSSPLFLFLFFRSSVYLANIRMSKISSRKFPTIYYPRNFSRHSRPEKRRREKKKKKKQKRKFSINSRTTFPEKEEVALKEHPVSESAIFLARGKTRDERERRGW